jgi:hypothetical protein
MRKPAETAVRAMNRTAIDAFVSPVIRKIPREILPPASVPGVQEIVYLPSVDDSPS